MKYGTIWARIGGGLIDLIIVLVISAIILFCWGLLIGLGGKEAYLSEEMQTQLWKGRGLLVGLLVDAIYTISMQASSQQATFGQKASDLIIVKSDGTKASVGVLMTRYFISLISSILLKLGYLVAVFTKRTQTLHDLITDTVVIDKSTSNYLSEINDINLNEEKENNQKNSLIIFVVIMIGLFLILKLAL
jgi:uncharacterized RDD family membrane protein YckC